LVKLGEMRKRCLVTLLKPLLLLLRDVQDDFLFCDKNTDLYVAIRAPGIAAAVLAGTDFVVAFEQKDLR
jgi:hypothetical protein